MEDKIIPLEKKKIIAKIISEKGVDYDKVIRYVEYNGKYFIIFINKFLMYSTVADNFHSLMGMSEIDEEEIDNFIKNFQ